MDDPKNFLRMAHAALVLRGFDRERDISDPIMRGVFKHGKALTREANYATKPTYRGAQRLSGMPLATKPVRLTRAIKRSPVTK